MVPNRGAGQKRFLDICLPPSSQDPDLQISNLPPGSGYGGQVSYFIETAVRLHRAGEGAPYTGLKPADIAVGPAIPAAERALETGDTEALETLLVAEVRHAVRARFAQAMSAQAASKESKAYADVAAARRQVSVELGFIGFAEGLYLATKGSAQRAE